MTGPGNPHLATPLRWDGPSPDRAALAAVLVHGRGQDPDFMAGIAERVGMPDVCRVYPAAADSSWYPGRFMDPVSENEPWLGNALQAVDRTLEAVEAGGIPLGRTVLIGFSQGACLLAEFLVRSPRPVAAVALLTGGYIGPDDLARTVHGRMPGVPVLLSSSRSDEWVPPQRVRQTASLFEAMGAAVTLRIHDAPEHGVDDAEVAAVRDLLGAATSQQP